MAQTTTLKIKLVRSYRNEKGNKVFTYEVEGSKESLEAYKKAQGGFYREDEETQKPLWFTTRGIGNTGTLIITRNGKIVPDMSEFDMADAVAKQYGGNLGDAIASEMAKKLVGNLRNRLSTSAPGVPNQEEKLEETPAEEKEGLGDLG